MPQDRSNARELSPKVVGIESARPVEAVFARPDLEEEVIGAVLSRGALFPAVAGLRREHFTDEAMWIVFEGLARLFADKGILSPASLAPRLGADLARIGGKQQLQALAAQGADMAAVDGIGEGVRVLRECALRRAADEVLKKGLQAIADGRIDAAGIFGRIESGLREAFAGASARSVGASEVALQVAERVAACRKPKSSGIREIDSALVGGFRPGLTVFGGLDGIGKSLLAGGFARALSEDNPDPVVSLLVSLELHPRIYETRAQSRALNLNPLHFEDTEHPDFPARLADLRQQAANTSDMRRYLYAPGEGIDRIRLDILADKHAHKTEVFIIDYIQLLKVHWERSGKHGALRDHLAGATAALRVFAEENEMIGIAFCQADEKGVPLDCEAIRHAASHYFHAMRDPASNSIALRSVKANLIPESDIGYDQIVMDRAGPHFRSKESGDDVL